MTTQKVHTCATVPGTGTEIIQRIMDTLDVPLVIIEDRRDIGRFVECDGLILLGGRDIGPWFYGEKNRYADKPNHERDSLEWAILRNAMTHRFPIMGICRGMQFINVAHGGSLFQDTYSQTKRPHRWQQHRVNLTGKLADYVPTNTVNSYHHQSVAMLADGLKVVGTANDGVIEAIYKPGVLGVQWHPELLFPAQPAWIHLFRWFVEGLQ